MNKPTPDEMTFEQAMTRLEEVVTELDRGDLALEEALKLFQEGTALREVCERKLASAEATVEQLLQHSAAQPAASEQTSAPSAPEDSSAVDSLFGDDDSV